MCALDATDPKRWVCVFCGSAMGHEGGFQEAARALGEGLASMGLGLVYGGARVGLMGALADAALKDNGKVIGVMPQELARYEVAHPGLTRLVWADDLHDRKQKMAESADAFVILPGGYGTLEEALEVISWRQLRLHQKPIFFLNTNDVFTPLLSLFSVLEAQGFAYSKGEQLFSVCNDAPTLLRALHASFERNP